MNANSFTPSGAPSFVHLRCHSEFSVVDGICRVDEWVQEAKTDRQGALALTDLSNTFGAVKFYQAARGKGIKPILGADVWLDGTEWGLPSTGQGINQRAQPRLLLLVQNQTGWLNLCELLSRAWTQQNGSQAAQTAQTGQAVVRRTWLQGLHSGLIALSGAQDGAVGMALAAGNTQLATDLAQQFAQLFDARFYLELQRVGRTPSNTTTLIGDEDYIAQVLPIASQLQIPVVATQPVQFMHPYEFEAHEARVCIATGEILGNPRRPKRFTTQQHFRTQAEMQALFADIPSALANSVAIAQRCNLLLTLGKPQLPNYPTPALPSGEPMPITQFFEEECQRGLDARLAKLFPKAAERDAQRPRYAERLAFEIATILKMGFPGYFLIVADFIQWAKQNACPVGPGRGSGAGSLVAYALQITDLDPIAYNLLFERFLNPDRVSMPDFDVDFCQENRDRVIDYVKGKYGMAAVSQIATFGTMAARAAIRDVGRVLDMSYTFCDGLSKLIPNKPGQSISLQYPPNPKPEGDKTAYALEQEPLLRERVEREEETRTLIELAQKLEGMTRNVGMHAGGVLIAPSKLTDFCPLYAQPGSDSAVSQFDKDDVEAIGLVKFDFLGLATLTILEQAKHFIRRGHAGMENFEFDALPLDDAKVYALFRSGKTEAIFQFESRGMQGMLRDAKPQRLEDLIAMNALYRPGPMDLIPSYIARKQGREPVAYPDPRVEPVLSETYGIMVYQEQVMQMAQVLGGYTLGGADLLRRAMGKKKVEEMAQERAKFQAGAQANGLSLAKANEVFDHMEKFAGYGFNKSHSAAYALLAYHTAWLKVHYTAEFYAANMTIELGDTDKLKVLLDDAKDFGISFEPPDINRGGYGFEPINKNTVRYGLGAIKGTGRQAIDAIVAEREAGGTFTSLFDFCGRCDRSKFNKRALEALIKAGAFDSLERNRARVHAAIDAAFEWAQQQEDNANQGGLFDMGFGDDAAQESTHGSSTQEPALPDVAPWSVKETLAHEKAALGLYFSAHLFDEYRAELKLLTKRSLAEALAAMPAPVEGKAQFRGERAEPQLLAGMVTDLRLINGNRGRVVLFKLDDGSAVVEASADEATFSAYRALQQNDELLITQGRLQHDRFSGSARLNVNQIWSLEAARCKFAKHLLVQSRQLQALAPFLQSLTRSYPPHVEESEHGSLVRGLSVRLAYTPPAGAKAEIALGNEARFYPSTEALARWHGQAFVESAQVVY